MNRTQVLRAAMLAGASLSGWVNRSDTIAAMGKTDAGISAIMHISLPTVRCHVTNAARKLNVIGRPHAIYKAATLGYVAGSPGARRPTAWRRASGG